MANILSIDIGTSKLCAVIFDMIADELVAIKSCANDSNIDLTMADYHEQCPEKIVQSIFGLIMDLSEEYSAELASVEGVSVSGQMHGVLLVNEKCEPVTNFITWRDKRALEFEDLLSSCNTADNFMATGTHLQSGYGGATLAWLFAHGKISNGCRALSMADYLVLRLTGKAATESTHAASWGILNIQKNDWCYPLIEKLGIDTEILLPVHRSAEPLGVITIDMAVELGLNRKVIVYSPVGDNQAGVIGTAGFDKNQMILNLGTGGQISVSQDSFDVIDGFEMRPMPHGGSILVGASLCGGWSYAYLCEFVKDLLKKIGNVELTNVEIFNKLDKLSSEADCSCGGLVVDTRFAGTRGEHDLRGEIKNIDTSNFNICNLGRAFLVGMVSELSNLASKIDTSEISRIFTCGNGVYKNPLLVEIIANIFRKTVVLSNVREEAAVGAALAVAQTIKLSRDIKYDQ
ncbi:MAG: FGGY family carbohydrate kinase [Kiritimatiellae bacterium]|jgi:sedoheptulokinase|nr:FGGY family carbohydrate kinase [Kiritimatiellia bacterium]